MLVGVSTGVLYNRINGINNQIDFFRENRATIDGIELSFSSPSKVNTAFKFGGLTSQNEAYVRQLKFNTIHLPWKEVVYSEKEHHFLKHLSELYNKLNARLAIIHPDCVNCLETYDTLLKFFPKLAVENMDSNKAMGSSINDIMKIVNYNENISVVLDIAHCMDTMQSFENFEKTFYSKVIEIHVSACEMNKDLPKSKHILLHKTDARPNITTRDVPLIMEGVISTPEELEDEINLLRSL